MHPAKTDPRRAFTLIDLLVVVALIAILAAMLLPSFSGPRKSRLIMCLSNLRQISLGYILWASDNTKRFPWETSTNAGGTLELIAQTNAADHYATLSHYLRNPALLTCPTDRRKLSTDSYVGFSNTNLSYFVSLDASLGAGLNPSDLTLSGDRHLTHGNQPVLPGLLTITNFAALGWQPGIHGSSNALSGVLSFADGHGEIVKSSKLPAIFQRQGITINRLVIP